MANKKKKPVSKLELVEKIATITASVANTIYIVWQILKG